MKLYSKRHHDKKKIEIGINEQLKLSDNKKNGIKHEIELKDNDRNIEITQIPLLDKEDVI